MIAAGLGEELDEIREVVERFPAPHDFDTAVGPIREGTMAALRFEVQGWIRGRPAIVVEHVTRMHPDMAPDWPQPPGHGGYRIEVQGSPIYTVDFAMMGEDGDHNTGGSPRYGHAHPQRDPRGLRRRRPACSRPSTSRSSRARSAQLRDASSGAAASDRHPAALAAQDVAPQRLGRRRRHVADLGVDHQPVVARRARCRADPDPSPRSR